MGDGSVFQATLLMHTTGPGPGPGDEYDIELATAGKIGADLPQVVGREGSAFSKYGQGSHGSTGVKDVVSSWGNGRGEMQDRSVEAMQEGTSGKKCKPTVSLLTVELPQTYQRCRPMPPKAPSRRVLTQPSTATQNDGYDNENSDLLLFTHDVLVNSSGQRYLVQDLLGQGTFGQVACCWAEALGKDVAVKVIKNQPAYYHQARVEIGILQLLNSRCDASDTHHIVRMLDYFVWRRHLCLVFERLDVNLFEVLKRNGFRGLSLNLLRLFLSQLLDALAVLRDAHIIHCDLKPENILLKSGNVGEIKLIDFGSACFENRTVYSYIQSRFYRSPEVVLGCSYTAAIDMWSFGCVAAELFLGLPLFPGASEHDLLARVIETRGLPPTWLLHSAKHTDKFFKRTTRPRSAEPYLGQGRGPGINRHVPPLPQGADYELLSQGEFELKNNCKAPAGKRYFKYTALADIISVYPMKGALTDEEVTRERRQRESFLDLLLGVLDLDPKTRWTPRQAASHPFITGEMFFGPFQPLPDPKRMPSGSYMEAGVNQTLSGSGELLPSPSLQQGTPASFNQSWLAASFTSPSTRIPVPPGHAQAHAQAHAIAMAALQHLSPQLGTSFTPSSAMSTLPLLGTSYASNSLAREGNPAALAAAAAAAAMTMAHSPARPPYVQLAGSYSCDTSNLPSSTPRWSHYGNMPAPLSLPLNTHMAGSVSGSLGAPNMMMSPLSPNDPVTAAAVAAASAARRLHLANIRRTTTAGSGSGASEPSPGLNMHRVDPSLQQRWRAALEQVSLGGDAQGLAGSTTLNGPLQRYPSYLQGSPQHPPLGQAPAAFSYGTSMDESCPSYMRQLQRMSSFGSYGRTTESRDITSEPTSKEGTPAQQHHATPTGSVPLEEAPSMNPSPGDWDPLYSDDLLLDEGQRPRIGEESDPGGARPPQDFLAAQELSQTLTPTWSLTCDAHPLRTAPRPPGILKAPPASTTNVRGSGHPMPLLGLSMTSTSGGPGLEPAFSSDSVGSGVLMSPWGTMHEGSVPHGPHMLPPPPPPPPDRERIGFPITSSLSSQQGSRHTKVQTIPEFTPYQPEALAPTHQAQGYSAPPTTVRLPNWPYSTFVRRDSSDDGRPTS